MKKLIVAFAALVGCGTTSTSALEDPRATDAVAIQTPASSPDEHGGPVIAALQTRDHRIELHAGSRVTVRTNDGAVIANDVTLDELKTNDPFLYEVCRSSFASNTPNRGASFIDARFDHPTQTGSSGL